MLKNDLNIKLDKLLDKIVETILGAKGKKEPAAVSLWPIPTPQGILFWGKEWSEKLSRVLHLIDDNNIDSSTVEQAVKFPSRLVHILWRTDAIKMSSLSKKEKLYIVEKLLDYLATFRKGDLWCDNGSNIIWDLKKLKKEKKDLAFFPRKDCKLLLKFEASLFLYTELIYWANHPLGHSFHGPNKNREGDILVREYFDLKTPVWEFSRKSNFSQVEIFEIYKQGTDLSLEFFERGIRSTKPFKQNLKQFALKVDGKLVEELETIGELYENLTSVIEEGGKFIQSLNICQLIEKHAQYWFYVLKPFCDLVHQEWGPPQKVLDNIYTKFDKVNALWENEVKKSFAEIKDMTLKHQKETLKSYFDPRV